MSCGKYQAITALLVCSVSTVGCSGEATPNKDYATKAADSYSANKWAAPVPVHVVTEDKAGAVAVVEQGDFIEIHLQEQSQIPGRWLLSNQTAQSRIKQDGQATLVYDNTGTKRVFRFQALRAGQTEVNFAFHPPPGAPKTHRVLTFKFDIR